VGLLGPFSKGSAAGSRGPYIEMMISEKTA